MSSDLTIVTDLFNLLEKIDTSKLSEDDILCLRVDDKYENNDVGINKFKELFLYVEDNWEKI